MRTSLLKIFCLAISLFLTQASDLFAQTYRVIRLNANGDYFYDMVKVGSTIRVTGRQNFQYGVASVNGTTVTFQPTTQFPENMTSISLISAITSTGTYGFGFGGISEGSGIGWRNDGSMVELYPYDGNGRVAQVKEANAQGLIIGDSIFPGESQAFPVMWMADPGAAETKSARIGGQYGTAQAVNSSGVVTGVVYGSPAGAFRYDLASNTFAVIVPNGYGSAVNDAGVIVGWINDPNGNYAAFRWNYTAKGEPTWTVLGQFQPWDVNSSGVIVGKTSSAGVMYANNSLIQLTSRLDASNPPSTGWVITSAWKILNSGEILARGRRNNGIEESVLLKPN